MMMFIVVRGSGALRFYCGLPLAHHYYEGPCFGNRDATLAISAIASVQWVGSDNDGGGDDGVAVVVASRAAGGN